MKHTHTPALRFPNFSDDWEEKKLGDIAEIKAGKDLDKSKLTASGYPVYGNALTNKGILGFYNTYEINVDAVTVTGRGDIGKAFYRKKKFNTVGRLISLVSNNNACFLSHAINQIHIFNESTGVPQLTAIQLAKYCINLPSLPEQEKIGNFLSLMDKKIELEENKLELLKERKKGWLQKLFNQDIRFKDDNGNDYPAWEEKKLGEISTPKQWKTIDSSQLLDEGYPVYGANGIIGYYKMYNHEQSAVCVTCRGATCGNVHFTKEKSYITGNAMVLESLKENLKYTYYYLDFRGFKDVVTGSAQPQITGQLLKTIKIPLPSLPEQEKIAGFLAKQDELIEAQEKKVELLKLQKKGLLQQMFV